MFNTVCLYPVCLSIIQQNWKVAILQQENVGHFVLMIINDYTINHFVCKSNNAEKCPSSVKSSFNFLFYLTNKVKSKETEYNNIKEH